MANSSKRFASITSFISHTTGLREINFPQKQLSNYCRDNECSFDKLINVYQAYYERFRQNYDNLNQIILLLCIALKKAELKLNDKQNEETEMILKKSLQFLQDIITSKMLLVCLASKSKDQSICQHYIYTKGFLNLLIPQLLAFQFIPQIIDLLQNCNKSLKTRNLIGMNFLIELMLVSTIGDNLTEESERKFRSLVMSVLQEKKQYILNLIWNTDKLKDRQLEFRELVYLRLDLESPQIYGLEVTGQGKIGTSEKTIFHPENWIIEAYQKRQNPSVWKNIKINSVLDIYQFLFKLQVFASSPHIEDLDSLIPNNQQFLELFSKFLMGENIIEETQNDRNLKVKNKKQNSSAVIKNISQIRKLLEGVDKPYQYVLKKQLSKLFSESTSDQDQERKDIQQIQTDP